MATHSYDDVLKQAQQLSEQDKSRLIRELSRGNAARKANSGKTLGECMEARGLKGIAAGPADLSTNPEYLDGFGEDRN